MYLFKTPPPPRLGRGLSGITAPPIKVVECPTPQARDHSTSLTIFYRGGGAALPPAFIGAVAAIPPYSNHIPFLTVFTIGIEQILYFCRTPPSNFQKKRLQPQRVKSNFFKWQGGGRYWNLMQRYAQHNGAPPPKKKRLNFWLIKKSITVVNHRHHTKKNTSPRIWKFLSCLIPRTKKKYIGKVNIPLVKTSLSNIHLTYWVLSD